MGAAALAIGAGVQAYGSYTAGQNKQQAYNLDANQKRATAAEVQIGANRDIQLSQQAAARSRAAQITAFGKSGVSVGTGSPLALLEQNASNAFDQVQSIQQAANFREGTLSTDATQDVNLGNQAATAGTLGAIGAIAGGFAKNPYTYDSRPTTTDSTGSILTGGNMSNTGVDAADYDPANYARLHYMNGNL